MMRRELSHEKDYDRLRDSVRVVSIESMKEEKSHATYLADVDDVGLTGHACDGHGGRLDHSTRGTLDSYTPSGANSRYGPTGQPTRGKGDDHPARICPTDPAAAVFVITARERQAREGLDMERSR